MNPRSHHNRAHLGGLAIGGDPGLSPQSTQREDLEFVRPLPQSTLPLFDPKIESPDVNTRPNFNQGQNSSRSPRLPRQNDHHPMRGVSQPEAKREPSNARSVQDQPSLPLYFQLILIFK